MPPVFDPEVLPPLFDPELPPPVPAPPDEGVASSLHAAAAKAATEAAPRTMKSLRFKVREDMAFPNVADGSNLPNRVNEVGTLGIYRNRMSAPRK
jgi:hypothetical protein